MGGRVTRSNQAHNDWSRRGGGSALALIVALHAGALWGLMQIQSVREAVEEAVPIMVGLVTLPPKEPPKPLIEPPPPPPKPRPVKPRPEPQMIAARTEAPVEMTAPLPEPEPVIVEEPPPPPPPAAAPVPIIPPNFVAAYLDNPAPAYPASSKRLGETGTVLLRVVVDENGRPESINVTTSSGFERLDRAAIDAVRRWKFVPAKQGDRPVKAAVLVPLEFQLSS
jgi:protein TonB